MLLADRYNFSTLNIICRIIYIYIYHTWKFDFYVIDDFIKQYKVKDLSCPYFNGKTMSAQPQRKWDQGNSSSFV